MFLLHHFRFKISNFPLPGCDDIIWQSPGQILIFHIWFQNTFMTDLVCPRGLVLHDGPELSVITVSYFEGGNKLDRSEVFGALSDDPCYLLWRPQIHLQIRTTTRFYKLHELKHNIVVVSDVIT